MPASPDGAPLPAAGISRFVVVLLFDGVDLLDVTGPPEVFALLQRETGDATGYQVALAAETMDPVTTSAGVRVLPDITFEEAAARSIDTLMVPGRSMSTTNAASTPSPIPPWSTG